MSFANYDIEAQKQFPGKQVENKESNSSLIQASSDLTTFISKELKLENLQKRVGTKRDSIQLRNSITQLIKESDGLYTKINKELDILTSKNLKSKDPKVVLAAKKLRQESQQSFKGYQIAVSNYNEKQQLSPEVTSTSGKQSNGDKQGLMSDAGDEHEYQSNDNNQKQQLQKQIQGLSESQVAYHADIAQEREEAIANISKGVQDINKIFHDLNEVTDQQGEQIDTVEDSISGYARNNQLAHHELVKADEYQRKKRKWSCVLLLALVIILLIVLAIIS